MDNSRKVFAGRLLPGERIAWSGQPSRGIVFVSSDSVVVPFSLVWCAGVITMLMQDAPLVILVPGSFFVVFGAYILVGRFVVDAWARANTYYALTNERVLIMRTRPFAKFTSLPLQGLPEFEIDERPDRRGTIRFAGSVSQAATSRSRGSLSPAFDRTPQFIAIADARKVFDMIQRAIRRQ